MAQLVLDHIHKTYGDYKANNDISFEVPQNKIFGLLGPNGAGKTTLIRIITNIIAPDEGTVMFDGRPLKSEDQSRIGYMPEERGLYKKMKVGEHLVYLARLKDMSKSEAQEKIRFWMKKFDIEDWWDKLVEDLSKGMQQKVQFIATVVHEPKVLILDEPFSGLDPINTNLIKNQIYELKQKGTTVIFSTHRMEQVEEICEEIVLINKGEKILQGDVSEIKQQFKKNQFLIEMEGEIPTSQLQKYDILEQDDRKILVQLTEDQDSNELLRSFIQANVHVTGFKEILPSLNEIFITQVEQQKS